MRDVIHAFNEVGLRALDPQWAGRRPRRISDDDEAFIVATADAARTVNGGRERLRQLLRRNDVSWQRTRTWKESKDPDFDAKLDRIEEVTTKFPDRCFAFDQFGPLSIRPHHGAAGPRSRIRTGCRRPTIARTASATSTAVTASATTNPGVSTGAAKAQTTPCPR